MQVSVYEGFMLSLKTIAGAVERKQKRLRGQIVTYLNFIFLLI